MRLMSSLLPTPWRPEDQRFSLTKSSCKIKIAQLTLPRIVSNTEPIKAACVWFALAGRKESCPPRSGSRKRKKEAYWHDNSGLVDVRKDLIPKGTKKDGLLPLRVHLHPGRVAVLLRSPESLLLHVTLERKGLLEPNVDATKLELDDAGVEEKPG